MTKTGPTGSVVSAPRGEARGRMAGGSSLAVQMKIPVGMPLGGKGIVGFAPPRPLWPVEGDQRSIVLLQVAWDGGGYFNFGPW